MYGATIGRLGILGVAACVNQACCALARSRIVQTRYAFHALWATRQHLISLASGGGQPNVNQDKVRAFKLPAPPLNEQTTIAAFLDRETAKIDALVAKKERLIELLQEKRTALISHAVTRGLNPNAPLRDSGIPWLGQIPAHWKPAIKLNRLALDRRASFVNGPFGSDLLTSELTDSGVPVIYIRDVKPDGYRRVSTVCVTEHKAAELDFCRVDSGDVLVSKVGDPPGTAAVYPAHEPSGIVTQDVIRLKTKPCEVLPEFLAALLNSNFGRGCIATISIESTRTRIDLGSFKEIRVPLPPLAEQQSIVDRLANETKQIDRLTATVRTAIDRLQEYRTALISAAVTGQIDVRKEAA